MNYKTKITELEPSYILGIVEAAQFIWEKQNEAINEYAELYWNVHKINNGIKVQAVWRNGEVNEDDQKELSDSWFFVYSNDTIDAVISDVSEILDNVIYFIK